MPFIFNKRFCSTFSSTSEKTTLTGNPTADKHMHVVDACFCPLPLRMTVSGWHKKTSGTTWEIECEETDKNEEIEPKKGYGTSVIWK